MSIDGYVDDATDQRLLLSNATDFDRVDALRATCDAILVGATTVRHDNPRLLVRAEARRREREARGLQPSPVKVTVTTSAKLDARAHFFTGGETGKLLYCTSAHVDVARDRFGSFATVVDGGESVQMRRLSEDLYARGVRRLLVEGGQSIHTQFLTDDLVDELQVVVAPFFIGDSRAPRFVGDGSFPWNPARQARLAQVHRVGDHVLLRYALSPRFDEKSPTDVTASGR
jgi:5-amino-6-(5-phosphoribosylamino)uracil reductase